MTLIVGPSLASRSFSCQNVSMALAFLASLALLQDDAKALVERLRSDSVEERDAAYRKLKEIGPSALPGIERAAKDGDAESARLAKRLLTTIAVLRKLTPELRKELPAFEERVADHPEAWSEILVEAAMNPEKHPGLRHRDLEILSAEAARSGEDIPGVCQIMIVRQLRGAIPEISR